MQEAPDLVTFPEKIISRKLHILCSEKSTECTKFMCQIFFYPKNSYSNSFLLSLLSNADMTRQFPYLVQMRENTDQKNSIFRQFLRSVPLRYGQE